MKWQDKPYLKLVKHVQEKFCNPYIRERDIECFGVCISCLSKITEAGHYYPTSTHPGMRFYVSNIHGQETSCNHHKSGNLLEYRKGLIRRHGKSYIEKLEHDEMLYKSFGQKLMRYEIIQIGLTYKRLLKERKWVFDQKEFMDEVEKTINY